MSNWTRMNKLASNRDEDHERLDATEKLTRRLDGLPGRRVARHP